MAITLNDITELKLDGTGSFDRLMSAVRLHIEDALNKNEITQAEAGQIYTNVIPSIVQEAVNFEMNKDLEELKVKQQEQLNMYTSEKLGLENEILKNQKVAGNYSVEEAKQRSITAKLENTTEEKRKQELFETELNKLNISNNILSHELEKSEYDKDIAKEQLTSMALQNKNEENRKQKLFEINVLKQNNENDILINQIEVSQEDIKIKKEQFNKLVIENTNEENRKQGLYELEIQKQSIENKILNVNIEKTNKELDISNEQLKSIIITNTKEEQRKEDLHQLGTEKAKIENAILENQKAKTEYDNDLAKAQLEATNTQTKLAEDDNKRKQDIHKYQLDELDLKLQYQYFENESKENEGKLIYEKLKTEREKNGTGDWNYKYYKSLQDYQNNLHYLDWHFAEATDTDGDVIQGILNNDETVITDSDGNDHDVDSDQAINYYPTIQTDDYTFYQYIDNYGDNVETYNISANEIVKLPKLTIMYKNTTTGDMDNTDIHVVKYDNDNKHFILNDSDNTTNDNSEYLGKSFIVISGSKYALGNSTAVNHINYTDNSDDPDWWKKLFTNDDAKIQTLEDFDTYRKKWKDDPDDSDFGGNGSDDTGKISVFEHTDLSINSTDNIVDVKIDDDYKKSFKYIVEQSTKVQEVEHDETKRRKSLYDYMIEEAKQKAELYKRQIQGFTEQRQDKLTKMAVDMQAVYASQNSGIPSPGSGFALDSLNPKAGGKANLYRTLLEGSIDFSNSPIGTESVKIKRYDIDNDD